VHLATEPKAEEMTQVSVALSVNTKGQLLTTTERRFWDTELDGLELAARSGTVDHGEAAKAAKTAVRSSLLIIPLLIVDILLVAGLTLLTVLCFSFRGLSPDEVVVISGAVTDYQTTDSGDLVMHLSGYQNSFYVSSSDMQFLDEQRFRQEIHGGEELHLSLTKYAHDSLNQQPGQTTVPVLGIRSNSVTYLPLEAIAADRSHQNRVVLPRLILALTAMLVPMMILTARMQLFSAIRQNLTEYFASHHFQGPEVD